MIALTVSQVLLWIVVIVMGAVIVALARQLGVLHERLAPVGALSIGAEPEIGAAAPRLVARALSGESREVGVPLRPGEAQLLLFIAPECPVCKKLIPVARRFARSEKLKVLFVGDGAVADHERLAEQFEIDRNQLAISTEIGVAFRVSKLPYAVLIDDAGIVAAKGLVNSREHLESLVVAHETGYASIQSYLTANKITTLGG